MKLQDAASTALVSVAIACAVVMTAITVRREFFPSRDSNAISLKPVPIPNWQKLAIGHRFGLSTAPVTIIEFSDFECPACRAFTTGALKAIRAQYPTQVSVVFRHWPLSYHRLAYPTARAAECAGLQARFEQFHDVVYAKQDSLGLKSFEDYARDSGVPDLAAFDRCTALSSSVAVIEADTLAAKAIGGKGTPTIVINGLRLPGAPDSTRLDQFVRNAIAEAQKGRN